MNSKKKIIACVLGCALTSLVGAADFKEGMELLQNNLPMRKQALNIANFLKPLSTHSDEQGTQYLRYQKEISGVKVFGEEKLVLVPKSNTDRPGFQAFRSLSEKEIRFMEANRSADVEPEISLERAFTIATRDLRKQGQLLHEAVPSHLAQAGELVFYRDLDEIYRLSYHVVLPGTYDGLKTSYDFFVDAKTGEIVNKIQNVYNVEGRGIDLTEGKMHTFDVMEKDGEHYLRHEGRNLNVYDGSIKNFSTDADGTWEDEGESRGDNQRAEVELYLNMGRTIDFFKEKFGFVWKNGSDPVMATAHVGTNFNNAYFSPWQGGFFFGDGSGTADGFDYLVRGLDVAAHEFSHGMIDLHMPLSYSGESGALNEHIADFFGAIVDGDDWEMGDNITVGDNPALRNMQDPTRGRGDLLTPGMKYSAWAKLKSDHNLKARIYPDRVSKKIKCSFWQDNGGVHLNSSIMNKFSFLAATGEEIMTQAIGRELLSNIYFKMLKEKILSSNASFEDFKAGLLAAAELVLQSDSRREAFLETLHKAFERIELQ